MADMMVTSDFTLNITCLAAPFQAEGMVGDKAWYYRSRHGHWGLEIDGKVIADGTESLNSKRSLDKIVEVLEPHIIQVCVAREDAQYDQAMDNYYG